MGICVTQPLGIARPAHRSLLTVTQHNVIVVLGMHFWLRGTGGDQRGSGHSCDGWGDNPCGKPLRAKEVST